jgi:hypothetical protein
MGASKSGGMRFRQLSDNEIAILKKAWERGKATRKHAKGDTVTYRYQGNFTIAFIKNGSYLLVGVAKWNPIDSENWEMAKDIALFRAIGNLAVGW